MNNLLKKMLIDLRNLQNNDGSFDSYYKQPFYQPLKKWMLYPSIKKTPFEIATILLPLLKVKDPIANSVINKGCIYLSKESFDLKVWSYSYLNYKHIVPFDIDSTALCSYVLSKNNYFINNNKLFENSLDKNYNYKLWIKNESLINELSFINKFRFFFRKILINNNIHSKHNLILPSDNECSINSNVILYLGVNKRTIKTWMKTQIDVLDSSHIDLFYINQCRRIYAFTRLLYYRSLVEKLSILDLTIKKIYELVNQYVKPKQNSFSIEKIFLANSLLFLGVKKDNFNRNLYDSCIRDIKNNTYLKIDAYYSSSKLNDRQPNGNPNTFFGSPSLTCSLFIEFLNLYDDL